MASGGGEGDAEDEEILSKQSQIRTYKRTRTRSGPTIKVGSKSQTLAIVDIVTPKIMIGFGLHRCIHTCFVD